MSSNPLVASEIEECAARWILRRDRGELGDSDRMALEIWLGADSRHRDAYLRLVDLWRLAPGLKAWRPASGRVHGDVLAGQAKKQRFVGGRRVSLAAACLLGLAVACSWYAVRHRGTYATEVGGYQRLLLQDGSVVQLNTDTRVKVRYSEQARTVQLLEGEAHFEVGRDANRPFDVLAGDTKVRAIGTAFSVRLFDQGQVDVLVTQGRVSLQSQGGPPSRLGIGEEARARPRGVEVSRVEPLDVTRRLSWQSGVLQFKSDRLAAVAAEFNRYNRRQIEIADAALEGIVVGGRFRANDLDSFVAAMHSVSGVQVEEHEDRIVLREALP